MAKPRTELHDILKDFCPKVYFQPPDNLKIEYPCIVYDIADIDARRADNRLYSTSVRYNLLYITRDPDDPTRMELLGLPYSEYDRHYVVDQLHHDSLTLYY